MYISGSLQIIQNVTQVPKKANGKCIEGCCVQLGENEYKNNICLRDATHLRIEFFRIMLLLSTLVPMTFKDLSHNNM